MSLPIISFIVLIISVILHEVSHGYMAEHLGDPTARILGRLTLNPIPHIDPMGSIVLPLLFVISGSPIVFGWAKPVPYDPRNIRGTAWKERYGGAIVAAAGPLVNIFLAIIFGILIRVGMFDVVMIQFFYVIVIVNISLAVFNLIPIPPLDGHHIMAALLPSSLRQKYLALSQYSFLLMFIVAFVLWGMVSPMVMIITRLITGM